MKFFNKHKKELFSGKLTTESITEKEKNKEDLDNAALENVIKKYNNFEIEEDELINYINKIKNQLKIVRVFRIDNAGVQNDTIVENSLLIELVWQTDKEKCKFCYTSFEKSSANKPTGFATLAAPDEFINIVKDCIKENQSLIINLHEHEFSVKIPILVLKKFIE